ncbi:hypothetical protein KP509_14G005300 [Ceratopteris richardii]|nr:hypothetical protein KP509_14G005300 [Ceratopteris richardii]
MWRSQMELNDVLVMTPMVLLDALRHGFLKLSSFKLLIFDECHRAQKKHPYAKIMREYYHSSMMMSAKPRIFGMTASPVTCKGLTSTEDSAKQIQQLELLLDAKVFTLENSEELEHYVPRPKEGKIFFLPPSHSFQHTLGQLKSILDKYERNYAAAVVNCDGYKDMEETYKKLWKKIRKQNASLLHSLEELGLLCAYVLASGLLKLMKEDVEWEQMNDERLKCSKKSFLQEAVEVLGASLHVTDLQIDSIQDCAQAVSRGFLTPKVFQLVNCLCNYRSTGNLRCIVFVERVSTAMVLSRILSKIGCLSFVKCNFLSGTTNHSDVMARKLQRNTLSEFHSGNLNVLVATDVAEEGLDVQQCSCVIRFDPPKTVRSLIQSRGRARMPNSDYIVFLEKDNEQQCGQFLALKQSEESMKDQALRRTYYSILPGSVQTESMEIFQVESTGASVSIDSSISLITRFCSNLPGDKFYKPHPEFVHDIVDGDDTSCICKLILPRNGPFHELIGPPRRSRTLAKQSVCLEACKLLHSMGQLTDHLIPVIDVEKPEEEEVMNISGKNIAGAGTNKRKELHGSVKTDALCGTWINSKEDIVLHSYILCFKFCQKEDDVYVDLVLLLGAPVDDDVANTEFPIHLSHGRKAIAKFFDAGEYLLTADQLEDAKAYHQLIFNGMSGKPSAMKSIKPSAANKIWDSSQVYLVLPLISGKPTEEMEEVPIDWKAVRNAAQSARLSSQLMSSQHSTDVHTYNAGLRMAYGSKIPSELVDMAVLTIHTGRLYSVVEVLDEVNACCPMEGTENHTYTSYFHYFAEKYNRVLTYPQQPLLRVKQSHRIHNLLRVDEATEKISKKKNNGFKGRTSILVELPPELCIYTGISAAVVRTLYLFPSVFHRFNALILAAQLRSSIAREIPQCSSVHGTLIMQALTTLRCLEGFSFEALELLGDSFLKYAVSRYLYLVYDRKHEGQLSNRRARLICNKTLHQLAVARLIPAYIRDEPFQPEYWKAPGMLSVKSAACKCNLENSTILGDSDDSGDQESGFVVRIGKTCSKGHRWMCSKTISDAVEALIGAFVSCGDSGPALGFMKWIGMEIDFDLALYEAARNRKVHPKLLNSINIVGIESQLDYVFLNKALLVEALTHASKEDPHDSYESVGGGCYQRLEFLGDAVLDFLITRHLFLTHPGLSPGVLSDLRSAAVNNECFARSAVKHKLQRYLRHGSGELLSQITSFVEAVEASDREDQEQSFGWEGAQGPKVLGDLVESIAGAILVDSGFDLDRVWTVMLRILSPLVTPSTLPIHPIRELHELCQSKGLSFIWKKTSCTAGQESIATIEIGVGNEVISESAKAPVKKTARKNAAQRIIIALGQRGIHHPRNERAAYDSNSMPLETCLVSEKQRFDGDTAAMNLSPVKKSPLANRECNSLDSRQAQVMSIAALEESNQLRSSDTDVIMRLVDDLEDQRSYFKADELPLESASQFADDLETSTDLKMSATLESRSEDETTSACCNDSFYIGKPLIENLTSTSYPEKLIKNLGDNILLRAKRKGECSDGIAEILVQRMVKGCGRATLNEFCIKRRWNGPKYTLIAQQDCRIREFIFKAEVCGPYGVFKGTSDPLPRKDHAKDDAAIKVLLAIKQSVNP